MYFSFYLQRDAVLDVQLFGEQPSPSRVCANSARFSVNSVQRRLAPSLYPDVVQRHTAAAGRAVRRLEVQPLRGRGVSDRYRRVGVALRLGDGLVRRHGVCRGG